MPNDGYLFGYSGFLLLILEKKRIMRYALKLHTILISIFICLLSLSCCSQKEKVLDQNVNLIEVKLGDVFEIELPSHPGTGYTWQVKDNIDTLYLKLIKQEYREIGDESLDIPGMDLFEFQALKKGETSITLWYIRLWKKDNSTNPNIRSEKYSIRIN